jgi:hypothetical protein
MTTKSDSDEKEYEEPVARRGTGGTPAYLVRALEILA